MDNIIESPFPKVGWYPEHKKELTQLLESCLTEATKLSKPAGLILPHAGLHFCGKTAGKALSSIRNHAYDQVIIIGPSHHYHMKNEAHLLKAKGFRTPLGECEIDIATTNKLLETGLFSCNSTVHKNEHSIQIELPWVQHLLPNTPIIPIVLGDCDTQTLSQFADAIKDVLTSETLLIISTDFTHYGQRFGYLPFTENIKENIKAIDLEAIDLISHKNQDNFQLFLHKHRPTICGRYALQLLLKCLSPNQPISLTGYSQSAELNGDWSHSVSYASLIIEGSWS